MIETFKRLIESQTEAALSTLAHCVARCPERLWNAPVAKYPFCQAAYHTLIFVDYYLGSDAASFRQQPFHRANPELFGDYEQMEDREPVCLYTRAQIDMYLKFCRTKLIGALAVETKASLSAAVKFPRKTFSRAELYVYNLRHIQHHAAQLILRLRLDTDIDIPWISAGWREPVPIGQA